jgi:UDP-N-acetylmuramate dehydrogenase
MMTAQKFESLRGELLINEPMSKHTSWRVGGPADRLYTPADEQDLANFVATLPTNEPLFWLGLGSNLLVRDGGIRGTVVSLQGSMAEMCVLDGNRVYAGAGVSCGKLARFCGKQNLVGAEFLAGIPGLLGGALAMNAGAYGGETWALVESVNTLDRHGFVNTQVASEFVVGYRTVKGPVDEGFVSAILKLVPGDGEAAAAQMRALLDKRNASQPIGLPSCGSVFRNPAGDYAARLIEACGLKGKTIGGAQVSPKHANFIINTGVATAKEIEMLIDFVRSEVKRQQGVDLHPEVKIVGDIKEKENANERK